MNNANGQHQPQQPLKDEGFVVLNTTTRQQVPVRELTDLELQIYRNSFAQQLAMLQKQFLQTVVLQGAISFEIERRAKPPVIIK